GPPADPVPIAFVARGPERGAHLLRLPFRRWRIPEGRLDDDPRRDEGRLVSRGLTLRSTRIRGSPPPPPPSAPTRGRSMPGEGRAHELPAGADEDRGVD